EAPPHRPAVRSRCPATSLARGHDSAHPRLLTERQQAVEASRYVRVPGRRSARAVDARDFMRATCASCATREERHLPRVDDMRKALAIGLFAVGCTDVTPEASTTSAIVNGQIDNGDPATVYLDL